MQIIDKLKDIHSAHSPEPCAKQNLRVYFYAVTR